MQIYEDRIRFGVHCGQQFSSVDDYLLLWERTEELGYDWISVFDHYRPPDRPEGPCFEGPTLLSAVAARTRRVRCGILVVAVANRHPAAVANIASTIDHVSGGRLELGVGAGGPDLAHDEYGLSSLPIRVRMEMLAETCTIVRRLWTEESTTFDGKHFRLTGARLEPKPLQDHLPLVIGGAGERRMLRIVAEHADIWNRVGDDVDVYRHQLDVLDDHCREVGRDPGEIRKSLLLRLVVTDSERDAQRRRAALLQGLPPDSPASRMTIAGTPDQCVERLRAYVELGVRDFLVGVKEPADWQTLELLAQHVAPALRGEATSTG